jgi:hypothetical protein
MLALYLRSLILSDHVTPLCFCVNPVLTFGIQPAFLGPTQEIVSHIRFEYKRENEKV